MCRTTSEMFCNWVLGLHAAHTKHKLTCTEINILERVVAIMLLSRANMVYKLHFFISAAATSSAGLTEIKHEVSNSTCMTVVILESKYASVAAVLTRANSIRLKSTCSSI